MFIRYKIIILILITVLFSNILKSQSSKGYQDDYFITSDLDTIILTRSYGPLWLGAIGGGNFNLDMGEVWILRKPYDDYDEILNYYVKYEPEKGWGYFFGAICDWQPPGSYWGASLRAYIDTWFSNAYWSYKNQDLLETEFYNTTKFSYLTFSPSVRFNFHPNFHLFAGPDISLNMSYLSTLKRKHEYSADIKHDYNWDQFDMNIRFMGHVGIAWEIIIADIYQKMRLAFSPYISIHAGTGMISDENNSWNTIAFRAGFSMRINPDEIKYDTLPYIPQPEPPIVLLASLDRKTNIKFPGFNLESFIISGEMTSVERGMVEEEYRIEPAVLEEAPARPEIIKAIAENPDIVLAGLGEPKEKINQEIARKNLKIDEDESFEFTTSESIDLTKELRYHLDQVAVYLKENPGAVLGITGHSDDQGTMRQNHERSVKRAEKVKAYLVRKGIEAGRLLANGKGSIEPIASNKTAAGRRKNRRVDVRIVPSAKNLRRR
jgi:outer membrane protein OmpA-like peptidoglycan-associated protein